MGPFKIYKLGNHLFKTNIWLYWQFYRLYKSLSDRKEIKFINSALKPGMVVLDIGANIGYYSRYFSKKVAPSGKIISFEPDLTNFLHLSNNTKKLGNVILNQSAVGNMDGSLHLYYSKDLNIDHQVYDNGTYRDFYDVPCVRIDSYFKQNETVDLIKIDIQGYDYYAVLGMVETIKRSDNVMILGELWPYACHKAGTSADKYLSLLKGLGFKLEILGIQQKNYDIYKDNENFYTNFIGKKS